MFCILFLGDSIKTIWRVKRSSGVILAIFGHFCKIEKARISAIWWTDIGSAWSLLSIFKNLARWHPVQKNYSRLKFNSNHANHKLWSIKNNSEHQKRHFPAGWFQYRRFSNWHHFSYCFLNRSKNWRKWFNFFVAVKLWSSRSAISGVLYSHIKYAEDVSYWCFISACITTFIVGLFHTCWIKMFSWNSIIIIRLH